MKIFKLENQHGCVQFTTYGGQVLSYLPAGGAEVLWCLPEAALQQAYAADKPLRGGIPLCWPWFRQHPAHAAAPQHGYGRVREWQLLAHTPNHATLRLELDGTDTAFPYRARADLSIKLAETLTLSLVTTNLGDEAFPLTQALHTYLKVGDLQQGFIDGLQGLPRWHLGRAEVLPALQDFLPVNTPTEDRFGPAALGKMTWHDQALQRQLITTPHHATHAVVWQPGVGGGVALGLTTEQTMEFVCIEPARLTPENLLPQQQSTLGLSLQAVNLGSA